jgi:ribosome-associated protein
LNLFLLVIWIFSAIMLTLKRIAQEDMATDSKIKSFLIVEAALKKKASKPVLLEMRGVTSFTDFFFICSGSSDRQVQAVAEGIREALEEKGFRPLGLEGMLEGKWVLMDYEDVVVHIFLEPVRQFYDLEGLWLDAPRISLQKEVNIGEGRRESEKGTG